MADKVQVIKGVAYWCDPNNMNKMAGKYVMKLGNLTEQQVAAFRSIGAYISFDTRIAADKPDHQGHYVTFKSESPVPVTDMAGNLLPPTVKIGNGSVVHVAFRVNQFNLKTTGKTVTSLKWLGLKVQELVTYDPEEANKKEATTLLDGISGEGFVFGQGNEENNFIGAPVNAPNFEDLFKDVA